MNGGSKPIDYPQVAPEDVVVGEWYWVLDQDNDGPHIFFAIPNKWFANSSFACDPVYSTDSDIIVAIYGPIPYPSELSSEVRP